MRRTLVDTECWLWWHLSPERLGAHALALFEERRAPLLLSAASRPSCPRTTDPFDRLLVAQAVLERCALLTADPQLLAYEVEIVWAGRHRQPAITRLRAPRRSR